jgi:hypothetical protein
MIRQCVWWNRSQITPLLQTPISQLNAKYSSIARNTSFMILSAFEQYKSVNATLSITVTISHLTPYMNDVRADTTSSIDSYNGAITDNCVTANFTCLKLHNGAMLAYQNLESFSGSNKTNTIYFKIEPDGRQTDSTTNGPGKALIVFLNTMHYIVEEPYLHGSVLSMELFSCIFK